jgi:hypothetical protein
MIHSSPLRVKAVVREEHGTTHQIPFPFRADPTGLDGLKLDQTARAAFVLVLDNAKSRGWRSRLSNATMGRILGRCPMTISRALGRLESAGLIRRDLIAGGRIRTGIVVTWDGVRRESLTEQASVRRESLRGSALESEGLGARAELIRSPVQSQDQTAPILSQGEDPESVVPEPAEAARFLRAMIEAGRKGVRQPAPSPAPPPAVEPRPTRSEEPRRSSPPSGPSRTPQDDARRAVEGMAVGCFKDARRAAWGPIPGRRRMTPAELERQLAEVRRKYGGKVPGGPSPAPPS